MKLEASDLWKGNLDKLTGIVRKAGWFLKRHLYHVTRDQFKFCLAGVATIGHDKIPHEKIDYPPTTNKENRGYFMEITKDYHANGSWDMNCQPKFEELAPEYWKDAGNDKEHHGYGHK
mmetsp:Transcript_34519/g.68553  ORF Transcript_34519/g.68553 Transcript_34519/m.68553 type:complete len:118 (+) Transcript_34519:685-1038(+)